MWGIFSALYTKAYNAVMRGAGDAVLTLAGGPQPVNQKLLTLDDITRPAAVSELEDEQAKPRKK
jgi:hypothetical protein